MIATASHPLRILLADDQEMMRYSVRAVCESLDDLVVVGEAKNGQEAVEMADRLTPHVVLMDLQMPVLDGLQAARQITQHHGETVVLILSVHAEQALVREALNNGARGYIQKGELTPDRLAHALQVVEAGGLFFDIRTGTGLLQSFFAE